MDGQGCSVCKAQKRSKQPSRQAAEGNAKKTDRRNIRNQRYFEEGAHVSREITSRSIQNNARPNREGAAVLVQRALPLGHRNLESSRSHQKTQQTADVAGRSTDGGGGRWAGSAGTTSVGAGRPSGSMCGGQGRRRKTLAGELTTHFCLQK